MRRPVADLHATARPDVLDSLMRAGVLDPAGARRARLVAQRTSESVVAVIHQLALADDASVVAALCEAFDLPSAHLHDAPDHAVPIDGLSIQHMRRKRVLVLGLEEDRVIVGVVDPAGRDGWSAVGFAARRPTSLRLMAFSDWREAFDRLYGVEEADRASAMADGGDDAVWADDAARVRDQSEAAPAVRLVDSILEQALAESASDIHIEPLPDRVRIRLRVDGELKVVAEEAAHLAAPMAARIKILANMDVADRRSPQDGRTSLAAKGRPIDVRISTVPSTYGETVALRLLRRDPRLLDLATLGFTRSVVELLEQVLVLRRGLFLVTGPTGSGKTTTLYGMLQRLRGEALKILSVEDPIEYFFPDVTQVQVNEEAGVTFASALRAFLRQDPDVMLVGEIRDSETARIAIQAALTGHLVLATLHTNDAPGAVSRLVDMGVDRFLVGATLTGVLSQRLARRLCEGCRRTRRPNHQETALLLEHGVAEPCATFDAVGCPACNGSGYRGRVAVGEGFWVDDTVREAIADETGVALNAALKDCRFRPLLAEAAVLASAGEVNLAEFRALMLA
jgi:general secretion pathway protein E